MTSRILVINPNSNVKVTRGLASTLKRFQDPPRIEIECHTIHQGPFGIETAEDLRMVEPLLSRKIRDSSEFDGYVIACYSDPGLAKCRRLTTKPVTGIQQAALATAVAFGGKFGVLALGPDSIQRHLAYMKRLGLENHLAGELPLGISVDQAANDPATFARIIDQGQRLIEDNGAAVLILGCAGMARHRRAAEERLGVPVIDPTQAAVAIVQGRLLG